MRCLPRDTKDGMLQLAIAQKDSSSMPLPKICCLNFKEVSVNHVPQNVITKSGRQQTQTPIFQSIDQSRLQIMSHLQLVEGHDQREATVMSLLCGLYMDLMNHSRSTVDPSQPISTLPILDISHQVRDVHPFDRSVRCHVRAT